MSARLAIVTATLDYERALTCMASWFDTTHAPVDLYLVQQARDQRDWVRAGTNMSGGTSFDYHTREILGVVPAFNLGVKQALHDGAEIIACLHDDLEIQQPRWDDTVVQLFKACPRAGLVGFGGAKGLGADELYKAPYHPMQLARQNFRSNMRDAEAHGVRSEMAEPVACLDGFSQIGLASFWKGLYPTPNDRVHPGLWNPPSDPWNNLFDLMEQWGVVHHFYDGMLGCFAKRLGYMTWYLPVACHHFGGRTAVADTRYHEWAAKQNPLAHDVGTGAPTPGDQVFWTRAHQIGYDQFRDVLPIRV